MAEIDQYDEVCARMNATGTDSITIQYAEGDVLADIENMPLLSDSIGDVIYDKKLQWISDEYDGATLEITII